MNIIQNTIHKSTKKDRLNIIIVPFTGDFENELSELGHNLYIIGNEKDIYSYYNNNNKIKPNNITLFPVIDNQLKISAITSYDLIISTGRIHYELAKRLQNVYQIPIILVEHDMPDLQKWQIKHINDEIIKNGPDAIIAYNTVIFKHWQSLGILVTEKTEWEKLFFKITKGAFNYDESICNTQ